MATPNEPAQPAQQEASDQVNSQSQPQPQPQSKTPTPAPPSTSSSTSTTTAAQPKRRPFPSIIGSCLCSQIRYRLLTSPLFVYACHCTDCQKTSGSAFGLFLTIETSSIALLTPTQPSIKIQQRSAGPISRSVTCPTCHVELWSASWLGTAAGVDGAVADVRVGTLDFASLFEPDVHSFVESKLSWVKLPEGARTTKRKFDHVELWPKASLQRLQNCIRKAQATKAEAAREAQKVAGAHVPGQVQVDRGHPLKPHVVDTGDDAIGDGEKTPTAVEFVDDAEAEDDEAFEKRYRETERALQNRLETLQKKLDDEQGKKTADLEWLTKNLELEDTKSGEGGPKV